MTDYWQPQTRSRKRTELAALMNIAAAALEAEDGHVAGLVSGARTDDIIASRPHAARNVGRGLSYWLYETTLVYIIWRAWMDATKPAALDWTAAQLSGEVRQPPKVRSKSYDLVVFASQHRPSFVFEAKRWNYPPKAMETALDKDAEKLRTMPPNLEHLTAPQKYILVFSYELAAGELDGKLESICRKSNLDVAGRAAFPASFWRRRKEVHGQFVLPAIEVRQPLRATSPTP